MSMKVSVIVPTYNRAEQLKTLLESLSMMKGKYPHEVIIIDDCSTDNTGKIAKKLYSIRYPFKIRYIYLKNNGGPAKARNRGIEISGGDAVAFTDSDCIAHPYWIQLLSEKLENDGDFVGVGGRVLPFRNNIYSRYYTFHRILEPPQSKKYLVSANCIYWREPVIKVGGFDEDISKPGGEDIGLSFKLYNLGYRFGFEEKAIIYHDYRASLKDFCKTFYNYGMGCRMVTEKYFSGGCE